MKIISNNLPKQLLFLIFTCSQLGAISSVATWSPDLDNEVKKIEVVEKTGLKWTNLSAKEQKKWDKDFEKRGLEQSIKLAKGQIRQTSDYLKEAKDILDNLTVSEAGATQQEQDELYHKAYLANTLLKRVGIMALDGSRLLNDGKALSAIPQVATGSPDLDDEVKKIEVVEKTGLKWTNLSAKEQKEWDKDFEERGLKYSIKNAKGQIGGTSDYLGKAKDILDNLTVPGAGASQQEKETFNHNVSLVNTYLKRVGILALDGSRLLNDGKPFEQK